MKLQELKIKKPKPNMVIYRLPDENNTARFKQISLVDGVLDEHSQQIFTVVKDDSYLLLNTSQLVLAEYEKNSSNHICSFTIFNDELGCEAQLYRLSIEDINEMLPALLSEVEKIQTVKLH